MYYITFRLLLVGQIFFLFFSSSWCARGLRYHCCTLLLSLKKVLMSRAFLKVSPTSTQTILITGCTSGIGRALIKEYAAMGHNVIGCGRRVDRLEKLKEELSNYSGRHIFLPCDTSDYESVLQFRDRLYEKNVDIDVLIANAGISLRPKALWEISNCDFDRIVQTNLNGVFYTFRAFVPTMIEMSCRPGSRKFKHNSYPAGWPITNKSPLTNITIYYF